ncbi:uncharacterized protein F4812DRAFT_427609 [Daldinia caldariorum]|uniref:uncharacterized protein n=1 Tax=Daldinia caldariorum TaxID=326644 RepID=UPI002007BA52|nr:uncharacterized protein F4812DRAFT_427609 [Daldinia caldariorum]KAI1467795.1 hypothetical protein F4812DRAFT_427609 [Daldinia caldariorum]
MISNISKSWFLIGLFTLRASAACSSYGVDYVNGGTYDIDPSSNDDFTFTTTFQGCDQESVQPVVVDPSSIVHSCSNITTTPAGTQVTSTCELKYSEMTTGIYRIVLTGNTIRFQRTIALIVGVPEVVTVTATPTVVVGVTSTPEATTIYKTITKTLTSTLPPATATIPCDGTTQTVTITPTEPTVTSTSSITRTVTDGKVTSYSTTTITKTAYCHYLTPPKPGPDPTICIGLACLPTVGIPISPETAAATGNANVVATAASVAATTVTVTETTYTVTSTSVTTVPPSTTTEDVYQTIIATVTPAPTTKCDDSRPPRTVTITRPFATFTQTDIAYITTHVEATVWVGQTSYKTSTNKSSKTSCSRNGGWYGADGIMAATATA